MILSRFFFLLFCFLPYSSFAQSVLDQQASEMEKQLIAPCCWAKTLDQEQSEVAIYMKQKIKQQLALGKSVEDIYAMFESEFGERVLAQPKKAGFNWLAWITPFALLSLGIVVLVYKVRNLSPTEIAEDIVQQSPATTTNPEDQKYIDQIDQELYRS